MAFSVHSAQTGKRQSLVWFLLTTLVLGLAFLGIKGYEYHEHISHHLFPGPQFDASLPPKTELFFYLYFVMTGLHGLHVLAGMGILAALAWMAWRSRFAEHPTPVVISGLYWHFVDLIWVFLYPLFYLIHG